MTTPSTRREFLKHLGLSAAAFPFVCNLPSLGFESSTAPKRRMIVMFSPNGTVPWDFWPDEEGELKSFKKILEPLEPFRDQTLTLHGVCDKIRGDGDNHMRGIGCLLTGIELFPGNIQGGSHTPAGWASGLSIDQEIKNYLQSKPETRTRFGSLEFGVVVPDRADTWTRMCYSGANKPIAPVDDPYQMFNKLYGNVKDRENLQSILDDLTTDLDKLSKMVSAEDRRLLDEHASFVRKMEQDLQSAPGPMHDIPELELGVVEDNDNIPKISKMQIDLLVNSFANDFARVSSLQFTNSVGQARMKWLDIDETHHTLSHEPDSNKEAHDKLTKINRWYCEQLAYLAKRLSETPEPGGEGSLLDNTTILWTNELGQGNSHTLDNIPWVMVGGGLGFQMGRALKYDKVPHNRLLLSLAHAFGHEIDRFGNPDYCGDGPLNNLV
ncbi:MAG: DUF1552 domain-containing protein [Planctomycetaceae bacterium]|nr:DUF1552 domain-containing protein [Planctomycetaceae bacterium]